MVFVGGQSVKAAGFVHWLRRSIPWVTTAVVILLIGLLYLVSKSLGGPEQGRSEDLFLWLLGVAAAGLLFLLLVVLGHVWRLIQDYRRGQPGARLTARLVLTFTALSIVPMLIVFYFSVSFVQRGIDSWFDVQIDQAMDDALRLSQQAFDVRMRQALDDTRRAAQALEERDNELVALVLSEVRRTTGAEEMTIYGQRNLIVASSSEDDRSLIPARPDESALVHARGGNDYIGLDPAADGRLRLRVAVPVGDELISDSRRQVLQALYTVPSDVNTLSNNVQEAFDEYRELVFLHQSLRQTFTFALVLAVVLSMLTAIWLAFLAAGRLLAPIRELAIGTRAVARGDYHLRLTVDRRDDLGQLVQSFNIMTARVRRAHGAVQELQKRADNEREYLQTVVAHLSSGVLTLSTEGEILQGNAACAAILEIPQARLAGISLAGPVVDWPQLAPLTEHFAPLLQNQAEQPAPQQQEAQLRVTTAGARKVLLARMAALPVMDEQPGGFVMVLEDVTALVQAQRDAAWSEVARRLAHEIKNPLTPIGLSAQRLRRRVLPELEGKQHEILDRASNTIIAQVEAMRHMVNEFADYARSPEISLKPLDLAQLLEDVVELYRGRPVKLDLASEQALCVQADANRLRQLLHNVIGNALQALEEHGLLEKDGRVVLNVTIVEAQNRNEDVVLLTVADNGPGFDETILERLFEPYATSRPKGTGLGLAIVKKIVEEHGGYILAWNAQDDPERSGACPDGLAAVGARLSIYLPQARQVNRETAE